VVQTLEANEVDFAMVSVLPKHLKVDRVELMENKLYLVGGTKHEVGSTRNMHKLFERLPLIYREQGSATRMAMEGFIRKNKLPSPKKIELTSNEAVKQAVKLSPAAQAFLLHLQEQKEEIIKDSFDWFEAY